MKIISKLSLLLLLCLSQMAVAQTQKNATNVRVNIDNEKVECTYDIPPNTVKYHYNVSIKTNDSRIVPKTMTGAADNITEGNDKKITWYYSTDGFSREQVSNLRIDVQADINKNYVTNEVRERLKYKQSRNNGLFLAGGVAVVGAGLLGYGLAQNKQADDDYSIYAHNLDRRNRTVYANDGARDALYETANKQHKKAQYFMAGGGVFLTGSAVLAWAALRRYKKITSSLTHNGHDFLNPDSEGWSLQLYNANTPVGLGLRYRF